MDVILPLRHIPSSSWQFINCAKTDAQVPLESPLSEINTPIYPRGNIRFPDLCMGFSPCFYVVSPNHHLNYPNDWADSVCMLEAPGLPPPVRTSSLSFSFEKKGQICLNKTLELYTTRLGLWKQRRVLVEVSKKQRAMCRKTSIWHLIENLKCIQLVVGYDWEMVSLLKVL